MEWFISTELFWEKSNTFPGITFFSLLPKRPKFSVPFIRITSARLPLEVKMADSRWESFIEYIKFCQYLLVKFTFFRHLCCLSSWHVTVKLQVRKTILIVGIWLFNTASFTKSTCLQHPWPQSWFLPRPSRHSVKMSNGIAHSHSVSFGERSQVPFVGKF